ncbi:TetR/AcrR family transcriptional regulator [Streptomyces sp. N2-109]|uniref:TetR/AcrR family transcriptional regulator n=1 Tax=Streptomyces gossypii TaxID=2883101 RepID=A0ABT2JNF4_9ACTN|nr:TetR/AcrR family transcriptional regulator [Streptomyces gossypii]MCT2589410.1 TetR/AcrR family transcriptional regulator [Streptomyces gossypii]
MGKSGDRRGGGGGDTGASLTGLRERKKQRMYQTVSDTAITLFLEKGFEHVSVAEVAAAAEISKPTLFRYFPAKEDLALHRFADHQDEAARVVAAGRAAGRSPLAALHRHFREALDRHDPVTGLNDEPRVLEFHGLLYSTPSLVARLHAYLDRSEQALADALAPVASDDLTARLAGGQIIAAQRILAEQNWARIHAGRTAEAAFPQAVQDADLAFGQLRSGLGQYA